MSGEVLFGEDDLDDAYDVALEGLRRKKACRNSDEFFCWFVRKYVLGDDADLNSYGEFRGRLGIRTLIRKKAEIQNDDGLYPPTDPEVADRKNIKAEVIREHYSGDTIEQFEEYGYFDDEDGDC